VGDEKERNVSIQRRIWKNRLRQKKDNTTIISDGVNSGINDGPTDEENFEENGEKMN